MKMNVSMSLSLLVVDDEGQAKQMIVRVYDHE